MTSHKKEDMMGNMNGRKEDSDKFDDIMWKGRYGGEKCMDAKMILTIFDVIIWKGRYGGEKWMAGGIKPQEIC
jgi:hypothetical protein